MAKRIEMATYGSINVLEVIEGPIPEPKSDEVVIKVFASAVNRADLEIRSGKWQIQAENPFPYILGLETCGTVYSKGSDVTLPLGKKVMTMMQQMSGIHGKRPGGYQEFVAVPANTLALLDDEAELVPMAALGLAAVTAYQGLQRLDIKEGDRVLIQGASGGVGSNAVALAKAMGAYVITPSRHREQKGELLAIGCDEVWDISAQALSAFADQSVDAVLEMIGGVSFSYSLGLLKKPGGRLCSIGAIRDSKAVIDIWDLLQELIITGWSSENLTCGQLQTSVDHIFALLSRGEIPVPPHQLFKLEEAALVHSALETGKITGRALLIP
jgi:NADPH:quinone reductase